MPSEKVIAQGKSWMMSGDLLRSAALTKPSMCSRLYLSRKLPSLAQLGSSVSQAISGFTHAIAAKTPYFPLAAACKIFNVLLLWRFVSGILAQSTIRILEVFCIRGLKGREGSDAMLSLTPSFRFHIRGERYKLG